MTLLRHVRYGSLLKALQWAKPLSSQWCQKAVPRLPRVLPWPALLHTPAHSIPPSLHTSLPDGPQTFWADAPSEPLTLLFPLLFMLFPQVPTWLTASLIPSPHVNIFLLRTSLTTCLESNSSTPPLFLLYFSSYCLSSSITPYNLPTYFIICLPL